MALLWAKPTCFIARGSADAGPEPGGVWSAGCKTHRLQSGQIDYDDDDDDDDGDDDDGNDDDDGDDYGNGDDEDDEKRR